MKRHPNLSFRKPEAVSLAKRKLKKAAEQLQEAENAASHTQPPIPAESILPQMKPLNKCVECGRKLAVKLHRGNSTQCSICKRYAHIKCAHAPHPHFVCSCCEDVESD